MDGQPSLGQFIWLVRRELQWAHELDRDQPLRFTVESVSLDLVVGTDKNSKGEGGLDLKVLGIGMAGKGGLEKMHRDESTVHVVLSARETDGTKWQVGAPDLEPPAPRAEAIPGASESPTRTKQVPDSGSYSPEPSA